MAKATQKSLYKQPLPRLPELFEGLIFLVRGQKVMLDSDLAALYGVQTKALNQAVRRNWERFPEDFMFQLAPEEADLLRSQIVTSSGRGGAKKPKTGRKTEKNTENLRSQIVTSSWKHGGRRHLSFAFTEQGVAMLSSILRSERAVKVNIGIMRTFVRLRQLLASHSDLERRLSELEQRYDQQFKSVFDAIRELIERPDPLKPEHGREIGFHAAGQLKEEPPSYRCFTFRPEPSR